MELSVKQIKKLREKTGAGIMQVKTALKEAKGDEEKAIEILRQQGQKVAQKKSSRETKEGLVEAYVHSNGKVAALITVACETDFVARNQEFKELAHDLAMQVVATDPQYLSPEEIPQAEVNKEKKIYQQQLKKEKKVKKVKNQIVKGKMEKYYQEVCLLKQPFIKDEEITIQKLLEEKVSRLGEKIEIIKFTRFQL